MLIGIDASRAFLKNRTGIEEYSYRVIKSLMNKLRNHQVVLYIRRSQKSKVKSQKFPENWRIKVINFPYLWTQLGLSLELLFHPIDALFIPAHTVPIIHPKNTVVTIHGLEYEFCPKAYSFWERMYMRCVIKNSCRWAKKIIAVSENTKRDLMKLYKVTEDKISVVYEGILSSKQQATRNKAKEYDSLSLVTCHSKYLLFVGRLEERKNICGIIEAFEILKEKYNILHKLVLAGKPGYGFERIKNKAESSKHRGEFIFKGFVRDEDKFKLIKNADVFLFPSFYEGFGLPILEAQGVGVPVVTSNISSMPEIVDSSAVLVNPKKPEEIAEVVWKLISDEKLRNDIINKGLENVKRFSWGKCGEEIKELIIC